MSTTIALRSLASAQPDNELCLADTMNLLDSMFRLPTRVRTLIEAQGVQRRRTMRDASWYVAGHGFAARNCAAVEVAQRLAADSAKEALSESRTDPADIGAIVVATSTIIAMPGIDGALVGSLGLPRSVLRVPIWGRGCAGGLAALRTAADISRGLDGQPVLVVVVDCCTANVQAEDRSIQNVLVTSLYADGAVAMVVGSPTHPDQLLVEESTSEQLPETSGASGWAVTDAGLSHFFDPSITTSAVNALPSLMGTLACERDPARRRRTTVLIHPAGREAITRMADALTLSTAVRRWSLHNLTMRGNLSGPAVLFALADFLEHQAALFASYPSARDRSKSVALVGTGPGYTLEIVSLGRQRVVHTLDVLGE